MKKKTRDMLNCNQCRRPMLNITTPKELEFKPEERRFSCEQCGTSVRKHSM
jgi:hypothetical protein